MLAQVSHDDVAVRTEVSGANTNVFTMTKRRQTCLIYITTTNLMWTKR